MVPVHDYSMAQEKNLLLRYSCTADLVRLIDADAVGREQQAHDVGGGVLAGQVARRPPNRRAVIQIGIIYN